MSLSFIDDIEHNSNEFAEKLLQNCSIILQRNCDNFENFLLFMNINIRFKYGDQLKNAIKELIIHFFDKWFEANENGDTMTVINVKEILEQMCKLKWHDLYEKEYMQAFIKLLEKVDIKLIKIS
jgi:hypothetical protein